MCSQIIGQPFVRSLSHGANTATDEYEQALESAVLNVLFYYVSRLGMKNGELQWH